MMIGLKIFIIYLTELIIKLKLLLLDDICLACVIRELCEARDSGFEQFVDRNQICNMIDMLCTR